MRVSRCMAVGNSNCQDAESVLQSMAIERGAFVVPLLTKQPIVRVLERSMCATAGS
jgi:hypothetical protein